MSTIYFQPPGINEEYCEVGTVLDSDPDYIHYLQEPCKILKSEVTIINKENVIFDKKSKSHKIMRKLLLGLALLLATNVAMSQETESRDLFKSETGFKITEFVSSKGTSVYFFYGFQNEEYKTITDIGSIFLRKKSDLKTLADMLSKFSEKPNGTDASYENKNYRITLYDFSPDIYIYVEGKINTMSKNKAKKMAEEIYTKIQLLKVE